MVAFSSLLLLLLSSFTLISAAVVPRPRPRQQTLNLKVLHEGGDLSPVLNENFPDPAVLKGKDGKWYAFATNSGGVTVQVARADNPLGSWTLLDKDAMTERTWFADSNTWAPDVQALGDGSYIMYFSGQLPDSHQHCIGVARSRDITGPYKPDAEPWACPTAEGGAIDASGFLDEATGRRYVVYKIDGNSKGAYTPCGTGVDDPALRTPLVLQRVDAADGATKIGGARELLDRDPALDGALVEAPNLVRRGRDGAYVLWYSSHCFQDPLYDVKYAYASSVEGPYRRGPEGPVLKRGDFGLVAPGGMQSARRADGQDFLLFHGNCAKGRCLFAAEYGEA